MTFGIGLLSLTAASIAGLHTVLGPDHYLPFVAMSRARGWSLPKTILVTLLCGFGHVLSSVLLGGLGIALGIGALKLQRLQGIRGDLAGWLLMAFGLVYLAWGIRRAARDRRHTHLHVHADGTVHAHEHTHAADHLHVHEVCAKGQYEEGQARASRSTDERRADSITPWVLFVIFLFGPCEPLIPLLMYAAAKGDAWGAVMVTVIFSVVTLGTMVGLVTVGYRMVQRLRAVGDGFLSPMERYAHALAGLVIALCGAAVQVGM